MSEEPKKKPALIDEWLAMGIALGTMFGIILDNIGLWLPIGLCVGSAIGEWKRRKNKKNNNPNDTTDKE